MKNKAVLLSRRPKRDIGDDRFPEVLQKLFAGKNVEKLILKI